MLKLKPDPTFVTAVKIPAPTGEIAIKVEFKHMAKDEYTAFIKQERENHRSDEDTIMDLAVNWFNVEGDFTRENLRQLCQQYHGAASAICATFIRELTQSRQEN